MTRNFISAAAILIGTIVGAGIFGIPYAVSKSGIMPGLFYLFFLGAAVLLIYLFMGEIVLRTNGKYRIIGYAEKYLGKTGKIFASISALFGLSGALLAYIVLAGKFLEIIFSSLTDISAFEFSVIFSLFLSFFVFRGIKLIAPIEIATNAIFFLLVLLILFFGLPEIKLGNLNNFLSSDFDNIFFVFGVILFSLSGWIVVPELTEVLKTSKERKDLKRVISFAVISSACIYFIFAFTVLGVSGKNTSADALLGLIPFLGPKIIFFGALAAVITLADSFLILALSLRNILRYDFKIPKVVASSVACFLPLLLFLAGIRQFVEIIGVVGAVVGAIEGVLIVLIFKAAKNKSDREPEYNLKIPAFLLYILIVIFALGGLSIFF